MADYRDFANPYYPYQKVITGANTLKGAEQIPYKLLVYLLDLPDAEGYYPADDNDRARVRLAKYIWYEDPFPLQKRLPTPEQKRSMLFDPNHPVIDSDEEKEAHPKGYRLYWQRMVGNSETDAKIMLKCYINRVLERRKFLTTIGVRFEVWVSTNLETNTGTSAYQRCFDIEQCLHEALDGVDMDGIGTVSFATADHSDNGSEALWTDSEYLGRSVHCSITWAEGPDRDRVFDWREA